MNKRLAKQILKQFLKYNEPPIHDAIIYHTYNKKEINQYTYKYLKTLSEQ
jgi:HD superfamily phosphohydrolase YqeK